MKNFINELQDTFSVVLEDEQLQDAYQKASQLIVTCLANGNKILVAGNGGSAAEAQHFVAEIVGRYKNERKGFPAITLSADTSILTAVGNDYGYEQIFSRQIEAYGQNGDIVIVISTSGNSQNIISALECAHMKGLQTIALLGRQGGLAKNISNINVIVNSDSTARIQEVHLFLIHCFCEHIDEHIK